MSYAINIRNVSKAKNYCPNDKMFLWVVTSRGERGLQKREPSFLAAVRILVDWDLSCA
jgi:hypothetical protein